VEGATEAEARWAEEMTWERFVAYGLFVVLSWIWIQTQRPRGRLIMVGGIIGLFVVFWLGLRFAGR
jgi:hypothetical protein